jgi:hypothetical protein
MTPCAASEVETCCAGNVAATGCSAGVGGTACSGVRGGTACGADPGGTVSAAERAGIVGALRLASPGGPFADATEVRPPLTSRRRWAVGEIAMALPQHSARARADRRLAPWSCPAWTASSPSRHASPADPGRTRWRRRPALELKLAGYSYREIMELLRGDLHERQPAPDRGPSGAARGGLRSRLFARNGAASGCAGRAAKRFGTLDHGRPQRRQPTR